MYCRNCGAELKPDASVCLSCGVLAGSGNRYCAKCGAQPDVNAVICIQCGTALKSVQRYKEAEGSVDSFGSAISSCFRKYATFKGRANRSEYWFWVLFNCIMSIIPLVSWIWVFVGLLPSIAVAVRRLHDIGKSGWWYFISFIPFVGFIWLIVLCCQESEPNSNKYGPNPNL